MRRTILAGSVLISAAILAPFAERFDAFAPASDWQRPGLDPRVPPAERPQMDAYDRTIREADDLIASLLAEIDRLGLAGRTLIVLLSDHGEAFKLIGGNAQPRANRRGQVFGHVIQRQFQFVEAQHRRPPLTPQPSARRPRRCSSSARSAPP